MESILSPEVMASVQEAITTIILATVTLISGLVVQLMYRLKPKVIAYVESLSHKIESEAHSASFKCAGEKLYSLAYNAVEQVHQEVVKPMKKAGIWDETVKSTAKKTALEIAMRNLGPKGLEELKVCLGQDEDSIRAQMGTFIEARVKAAKPS